MRQRKQGEEESTKLIERKRGRINYGWLPLYHNIIELTLNWSSIAMISPLHNVWNQCHRNSVSSWLSVSLSLSVSLGSSLSCFLSFVPFSSHGFLFLCIHFIAFLVPF
jgi:hypothetical protein